MGKPNARPCVVKHMDGGREKEAMAVFDGGKYYYWANPDVEIENVVSEQQDGRGTVDEVNILARQLGEWRGYSVQEGYEFHTSDHPVGRWCWQAASHIHKHYTGVDVKDATGGS